jgi:putative membrane protein (TIGR04086 family)
MLGINARNKTVRNDVSNVGLMKSLTALTMGVIIACALSCAVFIACALLLTYTNMGEGSVSLIVTVTCAISCAVAGFDAGKNADGKGWLWGIIAGAVYAVILILAGAFVVKAFSVNVRTLTLIAMCLAGGGLGGVIGINFKRK